MTDTVTIDSTPALDGMPDDLDPPKPVVDAVDKYVAAQTKKGKANAAFNKSRDAAIAIMREHALERVAFFNEKGQRKVLEIQELEGLKIRKPTEEGDDANIPNTNKPPGE